MNAPFPSHAQHIARQKKRNAITNAIGKATLAQAQEWKDSSEQTIFCVNFLGEFFGSIDEPGFDDAQRELEMHLDNVIETQTSTYEIVRYYKDPSKSSHTVEGQTGLTWQEARDYCDSPDTKGADWFDGFRKE